MPGISKFGALWNLGEEGRTQAIRVAIAAFAQSKGDVTAAAKILGVGRNTLFRYLERDETLRNALAAVREAHGWQIVNGRHYQPPST